jgi:hypothetical protein
MLIHLGNEGCETFVRYFLLGVEPDDAIPPHPVEIPDCSASYLAYWKTVLPDLLPDATFEESYIQIFNSRDLLLKGRQAELEQRAAHVQLAATYRIKSVKAVFIISK